jgi:hypothetical protein
LATSWRTVDTHTIVVHKCTNAVDLAKSFN